MWLRDYRAIAISTSTEKMREELPAFVQVRTVQYVPNIIRNASHLYNHGMTAGGGQAGGKGWRERIGTANTATNAVSSN